MEKREKEYREELMRSIYDLLFQLGADAGSSAFFHTAYTVYLAAETPERLMLVTKWLYPETAKHYHTNWRAVERNIRSTIRTVWINNPTLLRRLAHHRLYSRPAPTQFIAVLAAHLAPQKRADPPSRPVRPAPPNGPVSGEPAEEAPETRLF